MLAVAYEDFGEVVRYIGCAGEVDLFGEVVDSGASFGCGVAGFKLGHQNATT